MAKMTLKFKVNDPFFRYPTIVSHDAYLVQFGDSNDELFPRTSRILSQNGQHDLENQVNDPYFHYQPRVSQDACLVQIW